MAILLFMYLAVRCCVHTDGLLRKTVLVDGEQETEPELNLPGRTQRLTTHLILALMCFLFIQANFILVPFPTHRQQVPSIG